MSGKADADWLGDFLGQVEESLGKLGVELSGAACCNLGGEEGGRSPRVKVVCVAPGLKSSVADMGSRPRDQVVMVRVDSETSEALDAWVETGALKSRSEAAALFIREGLGVRADELERLRSAIDDVEQAKERLREEARVVLGGDDSD